VDQRRCWRQGQRLRLEEYLQRYPALATDEEAVLDLLDNELALREEAGEHPAEEEYFQRFPHLAEPLRRWFAMRATLQGPATVNARPKSEPETLIPPPEPKEPPRWPSVILDTYLACAYQSISESAAPAAIPPPEAPAVPGYEILDLLGRGGMGVVYKARQKSLNRPVALKMILTGLHAVPEELARFRIEAEAMALLQHPNIVQIYEVGELPDHSPYFALEYVEGGSLSQHLGGKPMLPRQAAAMAERLARVMHIVHCHGIIHRDLKPGNVLLTADGQPKITDFGLAKQVAADSSQTRTGALMGSPSYIAPEQASGKTRQITPATDVYALGAVLYEMLTGRPPFHGASALDTVLQVLEQPPERPRAINRTIDASLEAICLKCLEKAPQDRYPSAEALAEDLAAYLRGESVLADGNTSIRLLRLLLRETRHTEVMALWGKVLLCHSGMVLLLSLLVTGMQTAGLKAEQPHVYHGIICLAAATLLLPVWMFRVRNGPTLTTVERQLALVWAFIGVGVLLTGGIKYLIYAEAWRMSPVVVLEIGLGCACTGVLLGGSFYLLAVFCAVLALLLAWEPGLSPLVFGVPFAIGLFVPGWKYSRQKFPDAD
jgi:serine/threonine-protein kinase